MIARKFSPAVTGNAASLAALYCNAGLPCEIEAGPVGLVVYAPNARIANAVAAQLVVSFTTMGVVADAERAIFEKDEDVMTAYVATVRLDWDSF